MDISNRVGNKILKSPLFTFSLCGLCGILPDIDHAIAAQIGIPRDSLARLVHFPIFVVVSCLIIYLCTLLGGLYVKLVLMRRFGGDEGKDT